MCTCCDWPKELPWFKSQLKTVLMNDQFQFLQVTLREINSYHMESYYFDLSGLSNGTDQQESDLWVRD